MLKTLVGFDAWVEHNHTFLLKCRGLREKNVFRRKFNVALLVHFYITRYSDWPNCVIADFSQPEHNTTSLLPFNSNWNLRAIQNPATRPAIWFIQCCGGSIYLLAHETLLALFLCIMGGIDCGKQIFGILFKMVQLVSPTVTPSKCLPWCLNIIFRW